MNEDEIVKWKQKVLDEYLVQLQKEKEEKTKQQEIMRQQQAEKLLQEEKNKAAFTNGFNETIAWMTGGGAGLLFVFIAVVLKLNVINRITQYAKSLNK